jgi:diguanylate cyclase (GGDEF)-like protein/PAS domain S-box-containing protein
MKSQNPQERILPAQNRLKLALEMDTHRQEEEEIRLLSQVLDPAEPIHLLDGEKILYANRAACNMLGYTRDELGAMSVFDIDPVVTKERVEQIIETLNREKRAQFESVHRTKDGRLYDVEVTCALFPCEGKNLIISQIRDITDFNRMQKALATREQEYLNLAEGSPDYIIRYDLKGRILYLNAPLVERLELDNPEEVIGKRPGEAWPDGRYSAIEQAAARAIETNTLQIVEVSEILSEGEQKDFQILILPEKDVTGRIIGSIAFGRDITEHKRREDLLHKREQEFRAMIENAPDPVTRYDRDGRRIYVNPAFEKLMGKPGHLLLGRTPGEVPVGDHAEVGRRAQKAISRVIKEGVPAETEVIWEDGDGVEHCHQIRFVPEFDRDGEVQTVLSVARDISPLRAYQRQLHDLAYFDILTGLPNRALFFDYLQQAITDALLCNKGPLGLMLVDLDRFKAVNDSFGHHTGDRLLCEVGQRLRKKVREGDIVARLGGDEFAIILPKVPTCETLAAIASTLLAALAEPFKIEGKHLNVTASIGISSCPKDSRDAWELVQLADMAMYHARSRGRNNFLFHSVELTASAKKRLSLEAELGNAIKRRQFELFYQPTVELKSGRLVGAEALLRWHHPGSGIMTPDRFIDIAEETGMIIELGEWVFRTACLTAAKWNRAENAEIRMAINLSVRQFDQKGLVEMAKSILEDTRCRPEWVELEITESLLLEDREDILTTLEELRRIGFSIAMDDFGTGYSALGYLTKFPIDRLKIDRSFVSNIFNRKKSEALVKAFVFLAQTLDLSLVAEGVETRQQASFLRDIGCNHAQGYLFGKPVPQTQFEQMLTCHARSIRP